MQKFKQALRKRRDESHPVDTNEVPGTAPVSANTLGTNDASFSTHSSPRGRSDTDPSSQAAAVTAARAATQFAEDVAERNIAADHAALPPRRKPVAPGVGERVGRVDTGPQFTDEITSGLDRLSFGKPELTPADRARRPKTGDIPEQVKSRDVDTTVHERVLPAVTHETITPVVHHVREEAITRDIHNHDVYHRIQPIIDREVLPTKHYLQNERGETVEIPANDVPPGSTVAASWETAHWQAQTASMKTPESALDRALPRKYPKVGKFAKKHPPDVYERPDQRLDHRTLTTDDDAYRSYGHSPPKTRFLAAEDRARPRFDKADGVYGSMERGRDRNRKPPSLRSMSPSKASSTGSIRSKASSMHVRELSEY